MCELVECCTVTIVAGRGEGEAVIEIRWQVCNIHDIHWATTVRATIVRATIVRATTVPYSANVAKISRKVGMQGIYHDWQLVINDIIKQD